MSGVATAIFGAAVIAGGSAYMSSQAQKDAAKEASNSQSGAAVYATDAELKMWEKAQADWEPYLNAGYQGISSLRTQMPQYLQETVMPAYNNYMQGLGVSQYDPRAFGINPVTGQVGGDYTPSDSSALYNINGGSYQPLPLPSQNAQTGNLLASAPANYTAQGTGTNSLSATRTPVVRGNTPSLVSGQPNANAPASQDANRTKWDNAVQQELNRRKWKEGVETELRRRENAPERKEAVTTELQRRNMQNVISSSASPQHLNTSTMSGANYVPTATPANGYGSGELLPELPTLRQDMDFEWNADDPVYQYKMKQAQEAANRSLSKQGLLNSRAGVNTLSDVAMNVAAEDIDKQYNRNLAERDYRTQTAMDQYNLASQRGNTLYDRLLGQQNTLYGRLTGQQETALGRLGQAYGLGSNLYGTVNEQNLNLAKIGVGAAGSAGANSMQAGQQIGNNAMAAGNANAQAALASGQAQAGLYNSVGNNLMQGAATYANYQASQPSYYSGAQSYYAPSNTPLSDPNIAWNM